MRVSCWINPLTFFPFIPILSRAPFKREKLVKYPVKTGSEPLPAPKPLGFETVAALADALGLTQDELPRIIALNQHYRCFDVPKRSGGTRRICIPPEELKRVQRKLLDVSLGLLPTFRCVHGGKKGRGHVSHAYAHRKADSLFSLDVMNAFGSTTPQHVRDALRATNLYSDSCIDVIIELTMHEGCLPQGAPTSNALWSAACHALDYRLLAFAKAHGLTYTRYVDEFVFSRQRPKIKPSTRQRIMRIIELDGFRLHPEKIRYQERVHGDLEVTGIKIGAYRLPRIVLPQRKNLHLGKRQIEELRAFLHHALHDTSITRETVEGRLGTIRQINKLFYAGDGRPTPYGLPKRLYRLYAALRYARGWDRGTTVPFSWLADGDSAG